MCQWMQKKIEQPNRESRKRMRESLEIQTRCNRSPSVREHPPSRPHAPHASAPRDHWCGTYKHHKKCQWQCGQGSDGSIFWRDSIFLANLEDTNDNFPIFTSYAHFFRWVLFFIRYRQKYVLDDTAIYLKYIVRNGYNIHIIFKVKENKTFTAVEQLDHRAAGTVELKTKLLLRGALSGRMHHLGISHYLHSFIA